MKKTLFLSAILATALCSSAFALDITVASGETETQGGTTINGGTSTIVSEGTLNITGNLKFTNNATATFTATEESIKSTVNGYWLQLGNNNQAFASLLAKEGKSATYNATDGDIAVYTNSILTIGSGVTLNTRGIFYSSSDTNLNGKVQLDSEAHVNLTKKSVFHDLVIGSNSSVTNTAETLADTVTLTGGSSLSLKSSSTIANLMVTGEDNTFSSTSTSTITNLTLNAASALNISAATLNVTNLSGSGTLSGTINFGATVTHSGSITIGEGSTIALDHLTSTFVSDAVATSGIYDSRAVYTLAKGDTIAGLDNEEVHYTLNGEQKTVSVSGNDIFVSGMSSYVVAQGDTQTLAAVQSATGFADTDSVIVSGTLTLGTTTIQKDIFGTGTVQISNNRSKPAHLNNFEGVVEIVNGGTLVFQTSNQIASRASSIKIDSGAKLQAWQTTIANDIELAGGTLYADDQSTWSGKITLTAASTLEIDHYAQRNNNDTYVTLTGAIEGDNHNLTITQNGGLKLKNNVNLGTGKVNVTAAREIAIGLLDNTYGDNYTTFTAGGLTLAANTKLNMRYVKASFGDTVLNGNAISVYDNPSAASISMSSLTLKGDNTLAVNWKGAFNLGDVTGSGTLTATHTQSGAGDPLTLNLSIKDFSGTLSAPNNANTFVNVASANQADELNGTLSGNVTLNDGFTKIGDGALTLTGSLKAAGSVSISAGTLEYNVANSAMNVAENTVVSISQTGKFAHDGFEYMANGVGATATLTATTGVTSINVNSSALVVADAKMVKTSTGAKYVGVALDNVDFTAAGGIDSNFGLTVLFKDDKTQSLSNLTIEEANKVKVQNSNFSATTVANDGQLEIASGTSISIGSTSGVGSIAINGGLSLQSASEIGSISGTGSLNLSNSLTVTGGTTTIGALTLGEGSTITLGSADENGHNFDLTTTTLTVNGDATMNANLVVESGTLNFAAGAVLTMGCEVTISGSSVYVTIDGTFDDFMAYVRGGNYLLLIDGLEEGDADAQALTLNTVYINGQTNSELHLALVENTFTENGAYAIVVAPEPATATLSLLALAALASRRKRH